MTNELPRRLRRVAAGRGRGRPQPVDSSGEGAAGLVEFALAAAIVGALTGLAAATFRLLLDHGARLRTDLAHWAHGTFWGLVLVVLLCTAGTVVAASLVHRVEPHAEGSGIPRVEAVVEGRISPGRLRIAPVKYVGGLLAISSGLALGREGPSVQMGGAAAVLVARAGRLPRADLRILVAGGAAAGLATAFNAPIAGGVFVLEELLKRFDSRTTIATLVASASGFAAAHLIVHPGTDFRMRALHEPRLSEVGWVIAVGLVTGVLGVLYTRAVLFGLRRADSSRWPREARAAAVGALVGVLVWTAPDLAGSGDNLTQKALLAHGTVLALLGALALRFVLGVLSYAAGTPGGLFAPMLVLGSDAGLIIGLIAVQVSPHSAPDPAALALIGLAAFFTATVHAPITGLILAVEMTGTTDQLAPMLGACALAMLVAVALRSEPIYDLLTRRAAHAAEPDGDTPIV